MAEPPGALRIQYEPLDPLNHRTARASPYEVNLSPEELAAIAPDRIPLVVAARTIQLLREAGVNIPPARPEVVDIGRNEAPEQALDRITRELGVILTRQVLGAQASLNIHQAIVGLGIARSLLISKIEKKDAADA